MNSLILDRFASQPMHLRYLWKTFTAIGWGFWIYLWIPLLAPISIYLGIYHGTSSVVSHWQQLTTTLISHFSTVCVLICIFVAWAVLQKLGMSSVGNHRQKNRFKSPGIIQSSILTDQNLTIWRQAQRMTAIYEEKTGQIKDIEA